MPTQDDLFYHCPYATVQKVLAGKWALLVLYYLSRGTLRFGELQRLLPDLTQATLTKQLRALEAYGLVVRHVYPQVPPKVEYSLSEIGDAFKPVLASMEQWGKQYIAYRQGVEATDELYKG